MQEALEVCRGAAGEARQAQEAATSDAAAAAAAFTAAVPGLVAAAAAARDVLQDLSTQVLYDSLLDLNVIIVGDQLSHVRGVLPVLP